MAAGYAFGNAKTRTKPTIDGEIGYSRVRRTQQSSESTIVLDCFGLATKNTTISTSPPAWSHVPQAAKADYAAEARRTHGGKKDEHIPRRSSVPVPAMPVERAVAASMEVPLSHPTLGMNGRPWPWTSTGKMEHNCRTPLQISSSFCPAGAASHPGSSAKKQVFRASSAPLTAELYFSTPQRFPAWHLGHSACCLAFQMCIPSLGTPLLRLGCGTHFDYAMASQCKTTTSWKAPKKSLANTKPSPTTLKTKAQQRLRSTGVFRHGRTRGQEEDGDT
ncbi:hypothetical protein LTR27_005661 [Elasticomyces elasticus]|nr:hypothetical protein LTR27_005661 [Elasticomyces elasticus]